MRGADDKDILLVEDNPDDAELALRALERQKMDCRMIHVRDGLEALDFLYGRGSFEGRKRGGRPRLILLDLKLPKLDGFQVLRLLKADPELRTIPVVIFTSSTEERDMLESYRAGANSYLVKPVDFDRFGEAMRVLVLYWLLLNHLPGGTHDGA